MSNHVHLLVTPSAADACGNLMKGVGQGYVQYFNRTHQRTGTLWEGRYRACVADSARYVLACYRYIELNPVRAGIVDHPRKYLWSSCEANAVGQVDRLVSPHPEFLALGIAAYSQLLNEALDSDLVREIRDATRGGYPLGNASFKSALTVPKGRKLERGRPGRPVLSKTPDGGKESGSDPDLFSGGRVS
jgi:putative transposase